MKKSLVALAVLGAFAGTAFAQTSVTVYGLVDVGIVSETGAAAGSKLSLSSGIQSGSRLGFRGTEDLGGGLSANFVLETGLAIDGGGLTNNGATGGTGFGRQTFVGLKGGFGEITAGRQFTPLFSAVDNVDPMGTGLAGPSTILFGTGGIRMSNTLMYATPSMGGFSAKIGYGFGEVAGDTSGSRQIGVSATYANGPIYAALAHHNANNAASTDSAKNTFLGGTYNFGPAKAHLAYAINKGLGTTDSNDMLVGVTVPFGASTVMASYIRKNDKSATNADANVASIAYTYALSKRTNLYTSYASVNNKNTAAFTTANGAGDKEFNIGIRHKF